MRFLMRLFAMMSTATCVTLLILMGYFASRGTLNASTLTKVIALMNGIDITGNQLRQIMQESEDREQPDFDEILDARRRDGLDSDIRMRSLKEAKNDIALQMAELKLQRERFDERRSSFDRSLDEIRKGAQDEGLQEVQRTLQALEAEQAKEQLLRMYDDDEIDDVVSIIQAMPIDKRKDILAEFATPEEMDKLYEILRRIGEGMPTTGLIDEARGG
ncbi:hypothetical protein LOC71_23810 [Rhodopirellula sp. JC740]|uniref:Magnesium transporter MgtE intracellular domain-containing protein n=1 Tax=Rhodopirellula halodulae TaxID=2894198 RepID=A0ABS8NP38_9BACT|nr:MULTISPECIES: hypothetical protein [unclassified Rhodopirellula]MCC9645317.1 hypothetical protein [Rhodopirellula sp. JC740]MCC9655719.1 hypothetical protein [Rhodopirellula sp. JC737]